jgi:hypothetical protein
MAEKLWLCKHMVGTWRNRFAERRLDGLYDGPRRGAPREFCDDAIASTIRKMLETQFKGAAYWSLRQWPTRPVMSLQPCTALGVPSDCGPIARRLSSRN